MPAKGPCGPSASDTVAAMDAVPVKIALQSENTSGLWLKPKGAKAVLVLAHGAGVGMTHKAMAATSEGLAERGIATLRFNFLYMERGSGRPDAPPLAHAAIRAAVAEATQLAPKLPLFAGGRSFGGRMTSQAQAISPLPAVRGIVFFAFPLHLAGKPDVARAEHLASVKVPMLFVQGTRDALADITLLRNTVKSLGRRAKLASFDDADHSFHVPAKTGRKDADVMRDLLDTVRDWTMKLV
jgi:predicted alpha/beta-hydrolase family hydrolase